MNPYKFPVKFLICIVLWAVAFAACWKHAVVRIDYSSTRNCMAQLFYSATGDFSETFSLRKNIGKGPFQIKFNVPYARFYRFDPAMENAVPMQIRQICIEKGFRKITLAPRELDRCIRTQLRKTGEGAYVSTGADPVVLIDTEKFRDLEKWHLPLKNVYLILFAAAGCCAILLYQNSRVVQLMQKWPGLRNGTYRYPVLGVLFLLLVACGITGNPVGLIRGSGISEPVGEKLLLFQYRPIRTDDFIAHGSASAVSNYNHTPRFPLINRNTGLSGRNMLFLHDWGAPVLHPAVCLQPRC